MSLRIEWKKIQSQEVSFVYYNGEFTGTVLQAWTKGLTHHSLAQISALLGNNIRKMTERGCS